jgi:hypothetical protein
LQKQYGKGFSIFMILSHLMGLHKKQKLKVTLLRVGIKVETNSARNASKQEK